MKTKTLFLSFFLSGFIGISFAGTKPIKADLKEATVFFTGAELIHQTPAVSLKKGDNEIILEGLSPDIDRNSLKIKATNGVLISSFEFSIDFLSEGKNISSQTRILEDSIKYYKDKLETVNTEYKINKELSDILKRSTDKNVSGSEKGLPIDELVKTMDYYKTKNTELARVLSQNEKQIERYKKTIQKLENQVKEVSTKNSKTSGILKLALSAPMAVNASFEISYYTTQAAWVPFYDINVISTDKPILIESKAKIRQTTGLDWDKVKLSLSSAIPCNGKVAPLFSAWFLEEMRFTVSEEVKSKQDFAAQNTYGYINEPAPQALSGRVSGLQIQGISPVKPAEPLYVVDGELMTAENFKQIDPDRIKDVEVLKGESATSIYGSQGANGVMVISLKSSMDDYVSSGDNELNLTYSIDLPFSVPGNGKEQSLTLKKNEVSGKFQYYCAPKLDRETYLLAEIEDWEKLNLLTGKTNITYEGTYVGESIVDASGTSAKLSLTLGSDKRVTVKREKLRDFSSTKLLGNDSKQVFTYKLTVRNGQNKPVKMVLKDQYPISTQKNIEVELIEKDTTKPTVNKTELGVVTWEETLQPGETREYKLSYSVKYPKNMKLNL